MALCGGVSCILEPRVFVALSKAKMISPDGTSKPFCRTADGYGRGEGCGIVLLKPLKKVDIDIFCNFHTIVFSYISKCVLSVFLKTKVVQNLFAFRHLRISITSGAL